MKNLFRNDNNGVTVELCTHHKQTGKAMWINLFGTTSEIASKFDVHLPVLPTLTLAASKVRSISKKYNLIPQEHRHHYPDPIDCDKSDSNCSSQGFLSVPKVAKTPVKKRKRTTAPKTPCLLPKKERLPQKHHQPRLKTEEYFDAVFPRLKCQDQERTSGRKNH